MAKDPAFLFYSQDFYTGVAILNWEERGKFISILCLMHQQGRMKEETIRFLVGSVSDNLRAKFNVDDNGFWFNSRLELESEKRAKFTESRRNNGLSGGRPTKDKPSAKPKNNLSVKHMDNHMEDENENEVNIWKSDYSFLKQDGVWFEQEVVMKFKIPTQDLNNRLEQYWLSLQKSNFKGELKQIRAGAIKWLKTWSDRDSKPTGGKQEVITKKYERL